jgi:hypothetical protein
MNFQGENLPLFSSKFSSNSKTDELGGEFPPKLAFSLEKTELGGGFPLNAVYRTKKTGLSLK